MGSTNTDNLPRNLRICRLNKNLRQQDMADKLNIGRQTYCNYENGQRTPDVYTLARIADILGVTLDDLVRGEL